MSKKCPPAGSGHVNSWTWATACEGKRIGWPAEKVSQYLWENTTHSGDEAEYEIERAVSRVFELDGLPASEKWPTRDDRLIRTISSSGVTLDTLRRLSPFTETAQSKILRDLFPDDPLVWAAYSLKPERADTRPLRSWLPFASQLQFIVPNPMLSRNIPAGKKSRRCEQNTGRRRFLVIEQDQGNLDHQSAVLLHFARFAPLVLVVHSGGKSLHGWFYVADRSEEQSKHLMRVAVSLGADRATWCKCQPVRMPGGLRSDNLIQRVLLFNPEPLLLTSRL